MIITVVFSRLIYGLLNLRCTETIVFDYFTCVGEVFVFTLDSAFFACCLLQTRVSWLKF